MWTEKQFWLDSSWRAFRTFCQSLAGLLLAVQTSNQVAAMPEISVPWYGYLYSSAIAALVSLLQSIDRERAVTTSPSPESVTYATIYEPAAEPAADQIERVDPSMPSRTVQPLGFHSTPAHGCGESLR